MADMWMVRVNERERRIKRKKAKSAVVVLVGLLCSSSNGQNVWLWDPDYYFSYTHIFLIFNTFFHNRTNICK